MTVKQAVKDYTCHICPHVLNLPVPAGFIISTSAWNSFVEFNELRPKIDRLLAQADINSQVSLQKVSERLTRCINEAKISPDLEKEIEQATGTLAAQYPDRTFAVRSSAVGEDSSLSFAGQYRSLLHVKKNEILAAYKQILVSKFSPEAILYRIIKGLDDEETPMAVIVLVMVEARLSGVIATGNPAAPDELTTLVHSVAGLGDNLMAGQATPTIQEIRQLEGETVIIRHSPDNKEQELSDDQLLLLAGWADKIAAYYEQPQEIEWSCNTGNTLYLLQARRLKLLRDKPEKKGPDLQHLPLLLKGGATAAPGICCGPVFNMKINCRSTHHS